MNFHPLPTVRPLLKVLSLILPQFQIFATGVWILGWFQSSRQRVVDGHRPFSPTASCFKSSLETVPQALRFGSRHFPKISDVKRCWANFKETGRLMPLQV